MSGDLDTLVDIRGLGKVYRTDTVETHAVKDVDLSINRGEFLSICGSSGSGKSTLLSLLGTLEMPTSGDYLFSGKLITKFNTRQITTFRSKKLGFVFQSFNLIESMTVTENVILALRCAGESSAERRKEKAQNILEKVGMGHRAGHFPHQLSGGQQQRVAVARALVNQPELILADEPTGNLDSENSQIIMDLLKTENNNGATICMVTHDLDIAAYSSRRVNMEDGFLIGREVG